MQSPGVMFSTPFENCSTNFLREKAKNGCQKHVYNDLQATQLSARVVGAAK